MPTMYDSETPSAIPADAQIAAAYVDGQWPDYDQLIATHPDAAHVSITVEGAPGARVGDLEVPNFHSATFAECAAAGARWARLEIASGRRPTLYYSRFSDEGGVTINHAVVVAQALAAEGVNHADVDYWVADWTGAAHLIPGSVATQWASPSTGSGGNYDISETDGTWPGASGSPVPGPVPEPIPPAPVPPAPVPAPPQGGFMPPTLKLGDLSPAVRNAQRLLNVHNAGLKVDGDFGPLTHTATEHFQQIMGLVVDGIIGPKTWTDLDTFG